MVMVMPNVVAPIKKKASFLLRDGRSRPHFILSLAVDAILSVALVLASFHFATGSSRHNLSVALKNSGAVAFSATELQRLVKDEKLVAYWEGPISDDKYTIIATTPGEVTVSYFPKNADIHRIDPSLLVVQTHSNFTTGDAGAYALNVSGPGSFLMSQGAEGNSIQYNPATPNRVTVTIKNKNTAVTLFDSVPEAALTLAMKPGVVRKIS